MCVCLNNCFCISGRYRVRRTRVRWRRRRKPRSSMRKLFPQGRLQDWSSEWIRAMRRGQTWCFHYTKHSCSLKSQHVFCFKCDCPPTRPVFVYSRASGRKMEKFTVSVNIAANSNVTFILTHEELLQRKLGQYEIMTRVKPKQLVQHFEVCRCLHPILQNILSSSWLLSPVSHQSSPCLWQIVADIYEPQGIAFLDAYGTFISNELLPLVEKTVTDKKV